MRRLSTYEAQRKCFYSLKNCSKRRNLTRKWLVFILIEISNWKSYEILTFRAIYFSDCAFNLTMSNWLNIVNFIFRTRNTCCTDEKLNIFKDIVQSVKFQKQTLWKFYLVKKFSRAPFVLSFVAKASHFVRCAMLFMQIMVI